MLDYWFLHLLFGGLVVWLVWPVVKLAYDDMKVARSVTKSKPKEER